MYLHGKYCGPGNKLANGKAVDEIDAACKVHDHGYTKLGTSAYYKHNIYDENFIRELKRLRVKGGLTKQQRFVLNVAKGYFETKRKLAPWTDNMIREYGFTSARGSKRGKNTSPNSAFRPFKKQKPNKLPSNEYSRAAKIRFQAIRRAKQSKFGASAKSMFWRITRSSKGKGRKVHYL